MRKRFKRVIPWHYFAGVCLIIAFIFILYEYVERYCLINSGPDVLHVTHILRGVGTALIIGVFAAIFFFRFGEKTFTSFSGDTLPYLTASDENATYGSATWFIQMRWIAIALTTLAVLAGSRLTHVLPPENFYYLVMCIVALSLTNVLFVFHVRQTLKPYRSMVIQIITDLMILTLLLHYSGGIENPFFFAYVYHVIIAGVLLSRRDAVLLSFLAAFLFVSLVLVEVFQIIPHYYIGLFPHGEDHTSHAAHNFLFAFSRAASFIIVLGVTAYFTIRLREQIHLDEIGMIQAGKMAAVGELAGNIAHEINNPIGIIIGKLKLLLEEADEEGLAQKTIGELKKIDGEAERISHLARGLLTFARPSLGERQLQDVNKIIHSTLDFVKDQLNKSHISLQLQLRSMTKVKVNADEVKQSLLNLIHNAFDAMPDGGELFIESLEEEKSVKIVVRDTGAGVSREVISHVFEPFFTTKPVGKGTGLGLSVTHGLMTSHGGSIKIESDGKSGTTVVLIFPKD